MPGMDGSMMPQTHAENVFALFPQEIANLPVITDYSFWPGIQPFASLDPVEGIPVFQQAINPDDKGAEQDSISAAEQRNFPSDGFPKVLRPSIDIVRDIRLSVPDSPTPKTKEDDIPQSNKQSDKARISFWSSRAEMEEYFNSPAKEIGGLEGDEGRQIVQYFNCLNFIQIQNVVMSFWCLIGWIPHAVNVWDKLKVLSPSLPMRLPHGTVEQGSLRKREGRRM